VASHYFNTEENLVNLGPITDVSYYGVNEMGEEERQEFLAWYDENQKTEKRFEKRRVLEKYCQDDVTVLRQACRVCRREFMQMGITTASPCIKVLRKPFLQPDTIGLIPNGGYTCNNNYGKKALMWLLHMEETDGVKIIHDPNSREYRLPEMPRFSVDGYCPETHILYEFLLAIFAAIRASRSVTSPP